MKKFFLFSCLCYVLLPVMCSGIVPLRSNIIFNKDIYSLHADYEWTIIGAGPAGIIAVSLLLDMGICEKNILWVDPTFSIGRMGDFYQGVTGNTDNQSWIDFLTASPTIASLVEDDIADIKNLSPDSFEALSLIVKPLEKVTRYVRGKVHSKEGFTHSLEFYDSVWHIGFSQELFCTSKHVILATGSKPKELDYDYNAHVIPLDYALNFNILREIVHKNDTVGVFGSAHSAILILKYLCDIPHRETYSFYNNEISYAVDASGQLTNSTFGLKGKTAEWAREILEENCPSYLHRIKNTEENRKHFLNRCNKIIFAVGYQQNTIPVIQENGDAIDTMLFDPQTGVIGTRLYGIGIAFPGSTEINSKKGQIGLFSFMKYALLAMPHWIENRSIFDISPLDIIREMAILQNYIVLEAL